LKARERQKEVNYEWQMRNSLMMIQVTPTIRESLFSPIKWRRKVREDCIRINRGKRERWRERRKGRKWMVYSTESVIKRGKRKIVERKEKIGKYE
jgi:hypothetical protein